MVASGPRERTNDLAENLRFFCHVIFCMRAALASLSSTMVHRARDERLPGSVLRGPLVPPDKGGPAWTQVTTEHFVVKTDVDPDTATKAARKLEDMFSALAELGFASEDRPKMRIDVVYFGRHEDYAALRPAASAGQFFPGGLHDFERRPLAVFGGDFVNSTRTVLLHELTHLFVHYYYPQAPTWLNEGLAKYFETLVIEDGTAILGRALSTGPSREGALAREA